MANENFKIVSGASLYNIRNIFNNFIEALSDSGVSNVITNPEMTNTAYNNAQVEIAAWELDVQTLNVPGRNMIMNIGDTFRQDIASFAHLGDVYSLSVTLRNQKAGTLRVYNSESVSNPNDKRVFAWDGESVSTLLPSLAVAAAPYEDGTSGAQYFQTVNLAFITHESLKSANLWIEFESDENANNVSVETFCCVKGIFGFVDARGPAIFTHNVRYSVDVGVGFWELSSDNGHTWWPIFTGNPTDIQTIVDGMQDVFYTTTQSDARYLKKTGDIATGEIIFNNGILVKNHLNVVNGVTPRIYNNSIIFNYGDTEGRDFNLYVNATTNDAPMLKYRTGIGWYYRNEDGILRPFGSGGASAAGTGDANSEVEFFAEVLEHSGYRYATYNTLSNPDLITRSENVQFDGGADAVFISPKGGATQYIITNNIFTNVGGGDFREWFVVPLTDETNNGGITAYRSLTTDNTGLAPSVGYAGWAVFDLATEQLEASSISEMYLKFEFTNENIYFHSYAFFYGHWPWQYASPDLRLREVNTFTGTVTAGTTIPVPNGGTYAYGFDSLELYHNRSRLVIGIDYTEINESSVQLNLNMYAGDHLEFFEKYSNDQAVTDILNHINDTTAAHGINLIRNDVALLKGADTTTYPNYVVTTHNDTTAAHGFDLNTFASRIIVDVPVIAAYTLTGSNLGKRIVVDDTAALNITLPQNSTEAIPAGFRCIVRLEGAGSLTFVVQGGDVIHSPLGATQLTVRYTEATVTKKANGVWELNGDIV